MAHIEITEEQLSTLEEILNGYLAGFPSELYGTDYFSYDKTVKRVHKKEVIEDLVEKIHKAA